MRVETVHTLRSRRLVFGVFRSGPRLSGGRVPVCEKNQPVSIKSLLSCSLALLDLPTN
jgi:hypothetical protein